MKNLIACVCRICFNSVCTKSRILIVQIEFKSVVHVNNMIQCEYLLRRNHCCSHQVYGNWVLQHSRINSLKSVTPEFVALMEVFPIVNFLTWFFKDIAQNKRYFVCAYCEIVNREYFKHLFKFFIVCTCKWKIEVNERCYFFILFWDSV